MWHCQNQIYFICEIFPQSREINLNTRWTIVTPEIREDQNISQNVRIIFNKVGSRSIELIRVRRVCSFMTFEMPYFSKILDIIISYVAFINIIKYNNKKLSLSWSYSTFAISAYHHWSCEFVYRSGEVYSIQHHVIKFVSDLRQFVVFLRAL